ncbi:SDR family oxidoreductase [Myxococcota bacterium]|nr:SDR family oxidoreductase [Myxococcota bacterium]
MELRDRTALVTGGASGIGAAVVEALQSEGARVAVLDAVIDSARGEVNLRCDVTSEEQVGQSVASARESLGGLELAFINAGTAGVGSVLEISMEEWDRVSNVNLRGAFMTLQHCARAMVEGGRGGAIVTTASSAALLADRGFPHYSTSKIALTHLTRVAARELGPHGIRVNCVAPGPTRTPMTKPTEDIPGFQDRMLAATPLGRVGEAGDIAQAVLALFRLDWVTGQVLACDGGISLHSPTDVMDADS